MISEFMEEEPVTTSSSKDVKSSTNSNPVEGVIEGMREDIGELMASSTSKSSTSSTVKESTSFSSSTVQESSTSMVNSSAHLEGLMEGRMEELGSSLSSN